MIIDGEEFTKCRVCDDLVKSCFENPSHLDSHYNEKHKDILEQIQEYADGLGLSGDQLVH